MKTLLAVLAAACLGAAALLAIPALGATTRTVAVRDSYFGPATLTVPQGTTVRWAWRGTRLAHNVAVRRGPQRFRSGAPRRRGSFARTLRRAGSYRIVCEIHPGMGMTVRVR